MEATMESSNSTPTEEEKGKRQRSPAIYKVLGRLDDDPPDVYRMLDGDVKASGPTDARSQIIEGSASVKEAVEKGEIELVAISNRFWSSKRPGMQTKVTLDA